jgi:hypothetical protein
MRKQNEINETKDLDFKPKINKRSNQLSKRKSSYQSPNTTWLKEFKSSTDVSVISN